MRSVSRLVLAVIVLVSVLTWLTTPVTQVTLLKRFSADDESQGWAAKTKLTRFLAHAPGYSVAENM